MGRRRRHQTLRHRSAAGELLIAREEGRLDLIHSFERERCGFSRAFFYSTSECGKPLTDKTRKE